MKRCKKHLWENYFDQRFSGNAYKYIAQCLIATLAISITLALFNVFTNAVVIAAIGSSSFIVFSAPHRQQSRTRYVMGGYIVGIIAGISCYYLMQGLLALDTTLTLGFADEISGAIAVGLSIFFMVILNLQHPPAAGLALGLVINEWGFTLLW